MCLECIPFKRGVLALSGLASTHYWDQLPLGDRRRPQGVEFPNPAMVCTVCSSVGTLSLSDGNGPSHCIFDF